ncbi:hypothetical protein HPB48_005874 [Haemaphysalis longicornis]|uniref:Uncharacterized protein n=1 Tax=Haemaphysalis longicornis TaxID=44386 RepID=A0A9J6GPZ3_HAELO|nr:hypothetical protein HPB48_005874 [Haemaphysalis longicornis]
MDLSGGCRVERPQRWPGVCGGSPAAVTWPGPRARAERLLGGRRVAALRSASAPACAGLDLSWVGGPRDQAVRDLPRLLVEVRLCRLRLSDVALRLLAHQLPHLSRLDLSNCRGVTDMGIAVLGGSQGVAADCARRVAALRRCVGLRHLDLRDCPQVTDAACRRFVAQIRLPVTLKESKLIQVAST